MKTISVQIGLFLLLCLPLAAQQEPVFHHLNSRNRLKNDYVTAILRDSYGILWFGTQNGLDSYDGFRFRHYGLKPEDDYNDDVQEMMVDAADNIWLKINDAWFLYDRRGDSISDIVAPTLSQLLGETVTVPDKLSADEDKNLWIVSGRRLFYYNYIERRSRVLALPAGRTVKSIACRNVATYVLFDDGSFAAVDMTGFSLIPLPKAPIGAGHLRTSIMLDSDGDVWLYETQSVGRVYRFMTHQQAWEPFPRAGSGLHLSSDLINCIRDDGQGNIWMGTDNAGIDVFNKQSGKLTRITYDNKPWSISSNHVNTLYFDRLGMLWVGFAKHGIDYCNMGLNLPRSHHLPDDIDVACLSEDAHGNLYVATDGDGLLVTDRTGVTKRWLANTAIPAQFIDSKGALWLGTFEKGLYRLHNNRITHLGHEPNNPQSLPENSIWAIAEDNSGALWLGTLSRGLQCRTADGGTMLFNTDNSALPTNSITWLHYDGQHTLYIGTTSGLCSADTRTRHITLLDGNRRGTQRFVHYYITGIIADPRGLLWVATTKGISVYNAALDTIYNLTEREGLSSDNIYGMAEDDFGSVWVSTDAGITQIEPEVGDRFSCYPFYEEYGIPGITFNYHAVCKLRSGSIILGGTGGYVTIDPAHIVRRPIKTRAIFTALQIGNQNIEINLLYNNRKILNKNILLCDSIELRHNENSFSLDLAATNYVGNRTRLAYRLNNGEWLPLAGNRIAFHDLQYGVHRLQIKAFGSNGRWSNEITQMTISILPPFWLSGWAYCFYGLTILSFLAYIFINIHRRQKSRFEKHLLAIEAQKQHETDEEKLRFFTNISHDIRTPLSLVITPLEKMLSERPDEKTATLLHLMHRNARQLMDMVNQLLDFRKLDKQKAMLDASHGDLAAFIQEIISSFESYSDNRNVTLSMQLNVNSLEMDFDKNKMHRILMNLLSNAFKYNDTNGSIVVTIDRISETTGDSACIRVADTGKGIPDKHKQAVFDRFYQFHRDGTRSESGIGIGLHIVQEYVRLHGGTVRGEDNVPHGSVFVVTIPIADRSTVAARTVEPEKPLPETVAAEPNPTSRKRLLVVEDNDDFRRFIALSLEADYDTVTAADGNEALDLLHRTEFDMVISDVMMPEMDGLELCRRIKTDIALSHIPVLLLTAKTAEEQIIHGLRTGADEYITKPFNLDILKLRIAKWLDRARENRARFATMEVKPSEITISSLDEQLIQKAIALVEAHIDDADFSVEQLSAAIGMTRGHLYRKLMSITGSTPIEFIRTIRIKRGRQLLEKSQLTIAEIAYRVGYSPKQFTKYFKEIYGMAPKECKK